MSNTDEMVPVTSEEIEPFLPEGWAEGDDIFDVDSWTGGAAKADESEPAEDQEGVTEDEEGVEEDPHTTGESGEAEEPQDEGEEAPTTEQPTERPKLKFSAKIDHKVEDVELDENELPTIYQKAHVTDRVRARLDEVQPTLDKAARLAKILGYDTVDAMLDSAADSYRQGEIDRLTGEGVHPDVAKELVDSKVEKATAAQPQAAQAPQVESGQRDFRAEVASLLQDHPELRGTQLPDEVIQACVVQGRSLSGAFEEYLRKKSEAENKAVKAENKAVKAQNKRLKQNADAARRAPVRGVSKGGKPDSEPEDPFLVGFNSARW